MATQKPIYDIQTRIKMKRDTSANWTSNNPVLLDGELIIVETADGSVRFKIGDGSKKYSQLPFEDEAVRNLITQLGQEIDKKTKVSIETWLANVTSTSVDLEELIINKVPDKATYQAMQDQGLINENEIYLVEGSGIVVTPHGDSGKKIATITIDDEDFDIYAPNPDLTAYATKASPTFTGTPKAPTAAAGTNTTQIATTAFVQSAVDSLETNLVNNTTIVVKKAEYANTAGTADTAGHATTAGTASALDSEAEKQVQGIKVNNATNADNAGHATTSGTTSKLDDTAVAQVKGIKVTNATNADKATSATTAETANKVAKVLTFGSKSYDGSTAVTLSASDLGLEQAMRFKGVVSTLPTSNNVSGDVVLYNTKEYVWDGDSWVELGDEGSHSLKTHTHTVTHKPSGTVSKPTFTGTKATIESSYTPAGTVSKPTFTGEEATLESSYTPAGTVSKPTFSGTKATITSSYTPSGTVSKPTFSGTKATIKSSYTPAGTVSQPTFTGTATEHKHDFTGVQTDITINFTPEGTVSKPTFSGTAVTSGASTTSSGHTASIKPVTSVGTLPSATFSAGTLPSATLSKGTLPSLTFDQGALPSASLSAGTKPSASFSAGSLTKSVSEGPNRRMTLTYTAPTHSFSAGSYPTLTFDAGTLPSASLDKGTLPSLTFGAGTLPSLTFDAGSLPTLGTAVTVATSSHKHSVTAAGTVSQPTFTGTAGSVTTAYTPTGSISETSVTPVGTVSQPTFTGTAGTATAEYTPAGGVSQPTFTGTAGSATAEYTPAGSVSQPTFTGSAGKATVTYTPEGTISQPTFTGTAGKATVEYTPAGSVSKPTFTGSEATITTTQANA